MTGAAGGPSAAGYSGTPLARKLGIREGDTVALVGAPDGWAVPDLPAGVRVRHDLRARADVVVAFLGSEAELRRGADRLVRAVAPDAALWLAWPRKAAGHVSDLTEQSLRDRLLPTGLVDNKVAALDEDWSALRFVWRRERRPSVRQPGR
ncbi:MAG TPA: DUF3052 domain-containing protein [Acidimicrobiales bacterium]|nr:DUF3052 domain-containing protein [Acidimicrobiales bacterium]